MINRIKNKIVSDKHFFELFKGGVINFVFQIIGITLNYLFILIISRFYGAEGMGIFALSFTVLNIFVLFGRFGLDVSSVKFTGEFSDRNSYSDIKDFYIKILMLAIPINIFLTLTLFLSAPFIAKHIFHKTNLTIYFQLISIGILPMALRFIHANAIRGMKNIKIYSFLQNVSMHFFSLIFILLFMILNFKTYDYPLIALLGGLFIGFFFSIYFWLIESRFFYTIKSTSINIKQILSVSTPLLLTSSIMLVLGLADTIMLGIFKSEVDVGIYNVVYKVASAGMIVFMALNSISTPKFAAAFGEKNRKKIKTLYFQTSKLIILFSIPIYMIIFLFDKKLLGLFGETFTDGSFALTFLSVGFLIKSIFGTSEYIIQMSNQQKILVLYAFFCALLNIVLNFLLIPRYGINGASFASMMSIIIYQILLSYYVNSKLNISFLK